MEYRNKTTGQVITTASEIIGGMWEPVLKKKIEPEKAAEEAVSEEKKAATNKKTVSTRRRTRTK